MQTHRISYSAPAGISLRKWKCDVLNPSLVPATRSEGNHVKTARMRAMSRTYRKYQIRRLTTTIRIHDPLKRLANLSVRRIGKMNIVVQVRKVHGRPVRDRELEGVGTQGRIFLNVFSSPRVMKPDEGHMDANNDDGPKQSHYGKINKNQKLIPMS